MDQYLVVTGFTAQRLCEQVLSSSLDGGRLATIEMGRKFGPVPVCAPLGGAGSPSNTMSHG